MVALFILIAAQSMTPGQQAARDLLGPEHVSNRIDCIVRYPPDTPGRSEINETYLFPLRPHRQSAEERARVRYVTTMNDGRSFLREGRIESIAWERWPRFSARIVLNYGRVELDSDPEIAGRLVMSGRYRPSHGPDLLVRGECRFVPAVPANESASR